MVPVILAVLLSLCAGQAWGTDFYIDSTASCPSGNYSIANRNCTGSDGVSFNHTTISSMTAVVTGDTIYVRSGTYTTAIAIGSKVGGTGTNQFIKLIAYPGETVTFRPSNPNTHTITLTCTAHNFWFEGFVFDGINGNNDVARVMLRNCGATSPSYFVFKNNEMKNHQGHFILVNGIYWRIIGNYMHDQRSPCKLSEIYFPSGNPSNGDMHYNLYVASGSDIEIAYNEGTGGPGGYVQAYPGPFSGVVRIHHNYFHHNTWCYWQGYGGVSGSAAHGTQWDHNIIVSNGLFSTSNPAVDGLLIQGSVDNIKVFNNVIAQNKTYGVRINSGSTGIELRNNLNVSNGVGALTNASGGGVTQTGNIASGVITDYTVSSSNYILKAGSAAINAGVAISGFNYNGAAPDVGAFETVANPSCTITANVMSCIFPMSLNVPIQGLSNAGVTVGCTGSACPGSPTVNTVSRVTATDTHVGITISGIAGNACVAADQNWTLTYNSSLGSWTDSANIGLTPYTAGINQKIASFAGLAVSNQCTGSGGPGDPVGYHLFYKFNEATGTNANDESANNLDGTLTNGPLWGIGKTLAGVVTALGTDTHVAIPYGSGVNPSTQSMTIAFGVNVPAGTESSSRGEFGVSVGANQRLHIQGQSGTWRLGVQGSSAGASSSSLAVTSGWNHLCLVLNSVTDTATLHLNGVAGTGGAAKAYTSYVLASNFKLGLYDINTAPGGIYDDLVIYNGVESCSDIYTAFQAAPTPGVGTLTQSAVQWQGVYLYNGVPLNFGALNPSVDVVAMGGGATVFQVTCEPGVDCDATSFKLVYSKNESASVAASFGRLQQVPDTETSDGIWFGWEDIPGVLNTGTTTGRLVGACTATNGTTQLSSEQIPNVDLPQDGCITLRYLVKVGNIPGEYRELRLLTESGLPLDGGYADARINVVNHRGSAF